MRQCDTGHDETVLKFILAEQRNGGVPSDGQRAHEVHLELPRRGASSSDAPVARLDTNVVKIEPLVGQGILTLVEGLLRREDERDRGRTFVRRQRVHPAQLFRPGYGLPDIGRHFPDLFTIQSHARQPTFPGDDGRIQTGRVADAADRRGRPDRLPIGRNRYRALGNADFRQRPPRTGAAGREFSDALGNGAPHTVRLLRKEPACIGGRAHLRRRDGIREQAPQVGRKFRGIVWES